MQVPEPLSTPFRSLLALALLAVALAGLGQSALAAEGLAPATLAAPLLVVGLSGRHNLLGLSAWIAGGAVLGGVALYAVGVVLAPSIAIELLVGAGVAVGGGLGGVIRLLGLGEEAGSSGEADTFTAGGRAEAETTTPDPRPADLFDASPEPILYYDDAGDGPVVRAVNPAYETVFGVTSGAVEDAALGDALMVLGEADAIVTAASEGAAYVGTLTCETAEDDRPFAIRLASVSDAAGTRGYVLYTGLERDE